MLASVLASCIQQSSETFIDEEQQGFRRSRGLDDILQVSRRLAEEVCPLTGHGNHPAKPLWHWKGIPSSQPGGSVDLHEHTRLPQPFHSAALSTSWPHSISHENWRGLNRWLSSRSRIERWVPLPFFNLHHQAVLRDFPNRKRSEAASLTGWTPAGHEESIRRPIKSSLSSPFDGLFQGTIYSFPRGFPIIPVKNPSTMLGLSCNFSRPMHWTMKAWRLVDG